MEHSIYPTIWFLVLGVMMIGYAILDGFDLGLGPVLHIIGRTPKERGALLDTIGPVWNGNEVWLLAGGGAMVVAFPYLYAKAFSGFYLALMLVLWMLILRGVALEFRHQVDNPLWKEIWDVVFAVASTLLTVLFGVAVANVLRGVPLDQAQRFTGTLSLILNPFAILGGVMSLLILAMHGAAYVATKTEGVLQERARAVTYSTWYGALLVIIAFVAYSFGVRPDFTANFLKWPVLWLVPLLAVAALVSIPLRSRQEGDKSVFAATSTLIATLLLSAAAGMYPRMLPVPYGQDSAKDLTIWNTSSSQYSQSTALVIYVIGITIVAVYLLHMYRTWSGKVRVDDSHYA